MNAQDLIASCRELQQQSEAADVYLPNKAYDDLVEALLFARTEDHQHGPTAIAETLGFVGGVWPASVLDDPHRDPEPEPEPSSAPVGLMHP